MAGSADLFPYERVLRDLAGLLDEGRVRYALIGGVAVNLVASPRLTQDIDLIIDVPALEQPRLLEVMAARGATFGPSRSAAVVLQEWARDGLSHLLFGLIRIDMLRPIDPLHQEALETAQEIRWGELKLRVARGEYLILDKLIAARARDLDDVRRLAAALGDKIDRSIIDPWLDPIEQSGGLSRRNAEQLLRYGEA